MKTAEIRVLLWSGACAAAFVFANGALAPVMAQSASHVAVTDLPLAPPSVIATNQTGSLDALVTAFSVPFHELAAGASAGRGPAPGESWVIADLEMSLLCVAAGEFMMGSDIDLNLGQENYGPENPAHKVRFSKPYWVGKTEVTQRQWKTIMGNNPSKYRGEDLPVEMVNWQDCVDFAEKLTQRERAAGRLPAGYVYRLPTEAEWEYAARGGAKSKGYEYAGSDTMKDVGWQLSLPYSMALEGPHPVAQKKPNELGLYDMSGNVSEWVHDSFTSDYYEKSPELDPQGPAPWSGIRLLRGGSWSHMYKCRTRERHGGYMPETKTGQWGLRIVLAPVLSDTSEP